MVDSDTVARPLPADKPEKWGRWDADPSKREGRYSVALTLGARDSVDFKVSMR